MPVRCAPAVSGVTVTLTARWVPSFRIRTRSASRGNSFSFQEAQILEASPRQEPVEDLRARLTDGLTGRKARDGFGRPVEVADAEVFAHCEDPIGHAVQDGLEVSPFQEAGLERFWTGSTQISVSLRHMAYPRRAPRCHKRRR